MRVIIYLILTIQFLMSSFISISNFKVQMENNLLYADSTSIALSIRNLDEDNSTIIRMLENLAEKNNLEIYKHTYTSSSNLDIYASDCSLGGKVQLKQGIYPESEFGSYISTTPISSINDSNQVGIIKSFNDNLTVNIYDFSNLKHYDVTGVYYLNTTNVNKIELFIDDLDNNGINAQIIDMNFGIEVNKIKIFSNAIEICVMLCGMLSIIHFIIRELKNIFIYKMVGYSNMAITKEVLKKISIPFILSGMSMVLTWTFIYLVNSSFDYYLNILFLQFKIFIFYMVIYFITSLILINIYLYRYSVNTMIKGNKPFYSMLIFINFILKVSFLLIFSQSLVQCIDVSKELIEAKQSYAQWDKTENIFRINVQYTGLESTRDQREIDYYNKATKFLNELINQNGFLLDTYNFMPGENGYIYENNYFSNIPPEIAPNGRRITISESYLIYNPIETVEGVNVLERIENEPYTLNLLVPVQFQKFEDKIISIYKDEFFFRVVEVDNSYRQMLNQLPNKMSKSDVNINIIYVKDNQSYFTYQSHIASETNNLIIDPIVTIYNEYFCHASDSFAYLTTSAYFESTSKNPYNDIVALLLNANLNSISQISSVYDELGHEIASLNKTIKECIILMVGLLISNFLIIYHFISNYYEKNKYKLCLEEIVGYSFKDRNRWVLLTIIFLNLIPILFSLVLLKYKLVIISIICLILVLEVIMVMIFGNKLNKKNYAQVIKGED